MKYRDFAYHACRMRQVEGSLCLNLGGDRAEQHAVYPGTAQAATGRGGAGALPARRDESGAGRYARRRAQAKESPREVSWIALLRSQ